MTKTRFEFLTAAEKEKLNELTIGYGKLIAFSLETGMFSQTITNIRKNGYGHPDTVKELRIAMKKFASKNKAKSVA